MLGALPIAVSVYQAGIGRVNVLSGVAIQHTAGEDVTWKLKVVSALRAPLGKFESLR